MRITYVLGTRPEIIKLAPLIAASACENLPFSIIHTNQHYARAMDRVLFDELALPRPDHQLSIGSGSHGEQTGRMLVGIDRVLRDRRPDLVVVQGDTNSALAGGLAAVKLGIPVAHVEAGLRSHDRTMPEETNRVLIDHLSQHLFCPTPLQAGLLAAEGIADRRVQVTGNTVVDAAMTYAARARRQSEIHAVLGIRNEGYFLLTCHRPSNIDDPRGFAALMAAVAEIAEWADVPLIFPVHPRLSDAGRAIVARHRRIVAIDPVGYLDMLALQQGAALIMTDSGGVQEEACVLRRKCLILRTSTERPETLAVGGAELPTQLDTAGLRTAARRLLDRQVVWRNPFGDGHAHRRILDALGAVNGDRAPQPQSGQCPPSVERLPDRAGKAGR